MTEKSEKSDYDDFIDLALELCALGGFRIRNDAIREWLLSDSPRWYDQRTKLEHPRWWDPQAVILDDKRRGAHQ